MSCPSILLDLMRQESAGGLATTSAGVDSRCEHREGKRLRDILIELLTIASACLRSAPDHARLQAGVAIGPSGCPAGRQRLKSSPRPAQAAALHLRAHLDDVPNSSRRAPSHVLTRVAALYWMFRYRRSLAS